ncbi:hypothetical protein EXIGLDRAFT_750890 [Exidia glandulosa HHB12029]|uniref:BRCT domain-containing protein n=1 Tax=Exidia glandulosa HHB12029 TaxID=1314781 RepID=A0A165G4P4_EXIGL|nr:hypothetical protein EXIGLDRAFT_750890 [Exidia glandulosa HHB12029]
MTGRATRSKPNVVLRSPLKAPTRTLSKENPHHTTMTTRNLKRTRSPAHAQDAAHAASKRPKHDPSPLSPKNGDALPLPLALDSMPVDEPHQIPLPPSPKLAPTTPARAQPLPHKTPSRLPLPSSARKPFIGYKSSAAPSSRPVFLASSSTPARPAKGPLTRAANIRRYKQPTLASSSKKAAEKKPEPTIEVGSPRKATGIFARPIATSVPEDTAREMQNSLSRLDEALKKLAAPRPAPRSRPASSLGFASSSSSTAVDSTSSPKPASSSSIGRPGTSMGFTSASPSKIPTATKRLETIPGSPSRPSLAAPAAPMFAPTTPTRSASTSALVSQVPMSVSRRASAALRGLSRTLSELPPAPTLNGFVRSKKEGASSSFGPSSSSATSSSIPPPPSRAPSSRIAAIKASQPHPSPEDEARRKEKKDKETTPHLDVLKHCTIFVDVRTDEGDDAAPLFVDMLKGLGARILTRMSTSTRLTHIVFKSGLSNTVARYNALPEPRPHVVGIGWVVECVEKRARVDEYRFSVDLDTAETQAPSKSKSKSKFKRIKDGPLNPIKPRRLNKYDDPDSDEADNEDADGLTAAEESFLEFSFEKSILGVGVTVPSSAEKDKGPKQREIRDFFAPLEKRKSSSAAGGSGFRPHVHVRSPLRETFDLPEDDGEDEGEGGGDVVMLG